MTAKYSASVILLAVTLSCPNFATAVDIQGAKEIKCFDILETVSIEGKQFEDTSFLPLSSRLELYYVVQEVSPVDINDLQEDELYYEACLKTQPNENGTSVKLIGFGGRTSAYTMNYVPPTGIPNDVTHVFVPEHFDFKGESGRSGSTFVTLTDNSTFIFWATCWNDGEMTWSVSGPATGLPQEKVKQIHDHAESLGFKRHYFTGLRYDNC